MSKALSVAKYIRHEAEARERNPFFSPEFFALQDDYGRHLCKYPHSRVSIPFYLLPDDTIAALIQRVRDAMAAEDSDA